MCHTRIRAENTTDKTFERNAVTDYKKIPVLIAVKYPVLYEIRHTLLNIILAFSARRTEKRILTVKTTYHLRRIYSPLGCPSHSPWESSSKQSEYATACGSTVEINPIQSRV